MRVLYLADLLNLLTSLAASSFCFDAFVWHPMYNTVYILPMKLSQSCLQRSAHHLHYLVVSLPQPSLSKHLCSDTSSSRNIHFCMAMQILLVVILDSLMVLLNYSVFMRVQASLSNVVIASGASFICLLRSSRAMDMKGSSLSVSKMLPTCSCPVVVCVCSVTV